MSRLRVVNQGEEAFLDLVTAVNYTLRLFKTDVEAGLTEAQKEALTESSFTEATFAGYSAAALTGGLWTTTPSNPSVASYAQQTFTRTSTGTAQLIWGYYLVTTTGGFLRWYEQFDGPISVEFINDAVRVTPRITLDDIDTLEVAMDVQVFTSGGTWTKPAGLRSARVRVIGGGGGGGGAAGGASGHANGGSGGAGGYTEKVIAASDLAATEAVTVGAAGAAGSAGANNGGTGGTSSFGSHCSSTGGGGGTGSTNSTTNLVVNGGLGGTGSSGDVNQAGEDGTIGRVVGGVFVSQGTSGSSVMGGGRRGGSAADASLVGSASGAGGAGARATTTSTAGAAGAAGIVIVEEFF